MWSRNDATLSNKSARKDYGLTQEEIIAAIRVGKLQFCDSNIHGNPRFMGDEEEGYFEFDQKDNGQFHLDYGHGQMGCHVTTRDGELSIEWMSIRTILGLLLLIASPCVAAAMEWVKGSSDRKGFELVESGKLFVPWGFNYDHHADGNLLEDYWGKSPDELRPAKTILEAMTLGWLELFQKKTPQILAVVGSRPQYQQVTCEGTYQHHLQGICVNEAAVYWSFTTTLVKTDLDGKRLKEVPVANHHGDLCCHDGKLFVAVNLGKFNDPKGNADSWVYVYDADTLEEVARQEVQEVFHGAGGIGFRDGHFFVVGGLANGVEENYVYEYDSNFKFVKKHVIQSGHTHLGIQTATFVNDRWWFGCYGDPKVLLVTDAAFNMTGRFQFDCSLGIVGLPDGRLLAATGRCEQGKGCTGSAKVAVPDEKSGLRYINETGRTRSDDAK